MSELILTDAESDTLHAVTLDQTVQIQLAENPTTGYRWALEVSDPGAVELMDTSWQIAPDAAIGGGGMRIFKLRMRGKGPIRLDFKLGRSWQGESAVIERRQFSLEGVAEGTGLPKEEP